MADIIKFRGKDKKELTESEEVNTSILVCDQCGNSLFFMMEFDDSIIEPVCQHCKTSFNFDQETFVTVHDRDGIEHDVEDVSLTDRINKALLDLEKSEDALVTVEEILNDLADRLDEIII